MRDLAIAVLLVAFGTFEFVGVVFAKGLDTDKVAADPVVAPTAEEARAYYRLHDPVVDTSKIKAAPVQMSAAASRAYYRLHKIPSPVIDTDKLKP